MSDRPDYDPEFALQWVLADACSLVRRGNPDMGGPLSRDFQAADRILSVLHGHGYKIVKEDDE